MNYRFRAVCALLFAGLAATTTTAQTTSDSLAELSRKVEALTDDLERVTLGEAASPADPGKYGVGPASGKVYGAKKGVTVAGYGDLIYRRFPDSTDDGRATPQDRIDMYHAILYFGYRFNDQILFNSEFEYEHATTDKNIGYVAVEFAYLDFLFNDNVNLRTGLILNPLGIINETHEPTTYLTTLRPGTETNIVPTTWRGIGFGFWGEIIEDLNYRAYMMEGLNAAGFTSGGGIRGGRQHGANAIAEDFGFTGKLEYSGIEGIRVGAGFYTGNSGQGMMDTFVPDSLTPASGVDIAAATTIIEGHVFGNYEGIEFSAMYAMNSVSDTKLLNKNLSNQVIGSKQNGIYVTLGYDVMRLISKGSEHQLTPFFHWEQFNTQAEVEEGFTADKANDRSTIAFGLAYRPISNVIIKADYRNNSNTVDAGSTATDVVNLVLGYMF